MSFMDDVRDVEPAPPDPRVVEAESDKAYSDSAHPNHEAAVRRVREAYQQAEAPPDSPAPLGNEDFGDAAELQLQATGELARMAGVEVPSLPEGVTLTDSAVGDFLSWAMDEGLSKGTIQTVLTEYANWLTVEGRGLNGHAIERDGDEAIWKERLREAGLTERQATRLIQWHRLCAKGEWP